MDHNHRYEKAKSSINFKSISEIQSTESLAEDSAADSTDETRNSMTVGRSLKTLNQLILNKKTIHRREARYDGTDSTVAKRKQVRMIFSRSLFNHALPPLKLMVPAMSRIIVPYTIPGMI